MIDAKEAKRLYDASGAEVQAFLTNEVEPSIIKAATGGKRSIFILIGTVGPFDHLIDKIKPIERAVEKAINTLGYNCKIEKDGASYVPRGLADDDGNGPSHTNYGYKINW